MMCASPLGRGAQTRWAGREGSRLPSRGGSPGLVSWAWTPAWLQSSQLLSDCGRVARLDLITLPSVSEGGGNVQRWGQA